MNETQFVSKIDCRFPHDDLEAALRLADEACGISANAAFAVLDELTRPPRGRGAPAPYRLAVVERIESSLHHALAPTIIDLARRLIREETPSVAQAIEIMRAVSAHRDQYAALSIAYFSCDDVNDEADGEYQQIQACWEAACPSELDE